MVRRMLFVLGVGVATVCVAFGVRPASETEAQVGTQRCSVIFDFSGSSIDFEVPDGVQQVELDIYGAAGGDATGGSQGQNIGEGGLGAGVQNAILNVTPTDTLTVIVGGEGGPAAGPAGGKGIAAGGTGGFGYDGTIDGGQSGGTGGEAQEYHAGGGGGGASAVLRNGVLVAAAGGGGGGSHGGSGGDGGTVGGNGESTGTGRSDAFGRGATQAAGGAGGAGGNGGLNGQAGVQGAGGDGGAAVNTSGGQSSPGGDAGGGGGGGTFGGGGAGGSAASNPGGGAGGGGGSSTTTIDQVDDGEKDGDGQIVITLDQDTCPGDLAIDKSVSDRTPEIGDRITYTIKATNNGPVDPDTGVVVTDRLPPEVKFVRDDCERGSTNNNAPAPWRWHIGTLAEGKTVTCKITVDVVDSGLRIRNTAVIDGDNPDRNPDNNEDDADIRVPRLRYDLELVKRAAPTHVNVGDQVVYAVTASNLGPDRSEATAVFDLLPPQVAYVADTCDGSVHDVDPATVNGVDLPAGNYWVWRLGEISNRATRTCFITVQVQQPGTDIRNVAAVISHGRECCLRLKNNLDDATITVPSQPSPSAPPADLSITKSGPPSVDANTRFRWTMTVTNNGPGTSSGVTATDQIPAAIRHPATSTPGCKVTRRTLTCAIGALDPGESTDVVVTGRSPFISRCVTNAALVTGDQIDSIAANNHASARVCTRAPRIVLRKSTGRTVVRPGEVFSYRIVVRNVGRGPALRVRVCDRPSADLEIVRAPGAEPVSARRACSGHQGPPGGPEAHVHGDRAGPEQRRPGVKPNTATAEAANVRGVRRSRARVRVRPGGGACSAVIAYAACLRAPDDRKAARDDGHRRRRERRVPRERGRAGAAALGGDRGPPWRQAAGACQDDRGRDPQSVCPRASGSASSSPGTAGWSPGGG